MLPIILHRVHGWKVQEVGDSVVDDFLFLIKRQKKKWAIATTDEEAEVTLVWLLWFPLHFCFCLGSDMFTEWPVFV